mgnify:CR=1 FL=1
MQHPPHAPRERRRESGSPGLRAIRRYHAGAQFPQRCVAHEREVHATAVGGAGKERDVEIKRKRRFTKRSEVNGSRLFWRTVLCLWHRAVAISGSTGGELPKLVAV